MINIFRYKKEFTMRNKSKVLKPVALDQEKATILELRPFFTELWDFVDLGIDRPNIMRMLKITHTEYDYAMQNKKKFKAIYGADDTKNGKFKYKDNFY